MIAEVIEKSYVCKAELLLFKNDISYTFMSAPMRLIFNIKYQLI